MLPKRHSRLKSLVALAVVWHQKYGSFTSWNDYMINYVKKKIQHYSAVEFFIEDTEYGAFGSRFTETVFPARNLRITFKL